MAARLPHKVWGYVRLFTRPYLMYYYHKCKAGWPAPQPPRPIPPEITEPPSPIVFVEPVIVPDLAYDTPTPTTTPDDDPPASVKLLSLSALLGAAGFFLCLAGILRAKAKEERAARRRLLHLQGGWRAVAAAGMLPPDYNDA